MISSTSRIAASGEIITCCRRRAAHLHRSIVARPLRWFDRFPLDCANDLASDPRRRTTFDFAGAMADQYREVGLRQRSGSSRPPRFGSPGAKSDYSVASILAIVGCERTEFTLMPLSLAHNMSGIFSK
jgi:hypothetical protein